jgi:hypothetical protein
MLHAYAARFDVTGNLEKFWELNKALKLLLHPSRYAYRSNCRSRDLGAHGSSAQYVIVSRSRVCDCVSAPTELLQRKC